MVYTFITHFLCFLAGIFFSFLLMKPEDEEVIRKLEIENKFLKRRLFLLEKFIRRSARRKKKK